jgi:hypothetical protein
VRYGTSAIALGLKNGSIGWVISLGSCTGQVASRNFVCSHLGLRRLEKKKKDQKQSKQKTTDRLSFFRSFFWRANGLCAPAVGMAPHLGTSSWMRGLRLRASSHLMPPLYGVFATHFFFYCWCHGGDGASQLPDGLKMTRDAQQNRPKKHPPTQKQPTDSLPPPFFFKAPLRASLRGPALLLLARFV